MYTFTLTNQPNPTAPYRVAVYRDGDWWMQWDGSLEYVSESLREWTRDKGITITDNHAAA